MGRTYDGVHRTTFIIDENGALASVITKVKVDDSAGQVLSELGL